ncbi:hypothetical protein ACFP81_13155 [Deinococcus lacus]|uniref:Uncharacterized protein n=1 Tax=Deinococcus lacus TaxID=392561 RepID=A0ABW1YJ03_9DEIO
MTSSANISGELTGPSGADLDLYLQGWTADGWAYVAASEGPTSAESISYQLSQGSLRWVVYAASGSGSFTLKSSH